MSLPRRSFLLLAAPILAIQAPLPAMAAPDEAGFRALNRAAVEQVLLPAYRRFAEATANLAARLDTLARTPAEQAALKILLSTRLPPALDIPLGFNALDGD